MKALTLIQPWAWAVAHAGKNIENRTWPAPKYMFDQLIAIHAGKKYDDTAEGWMRERGLIRAPLPDEARRAGAIVAVCIITGWAGQAPNAPWFTGPCGWLIPHVATLETPIPCTGAQGLWNVPAEHNEALFEACIEGARQKYQKQPWAPDPLTRAALHDAVCRTPGPLTTRTFRRV